MRILKQNQRKIEKEDRRNSQGFLQRKISMLLVVIVVIATSFTYLAQGKAATTNAERTVTDFVGTWSATGFVMGTDKYSAYLTMRVMEDGTFSIYDAEAGNPGIEGQLSVADKTTIKLICKADDFDSPWPELELEDELQYHFYNTNQVRMTYHNTSIVFVKEGKGVRLSKLFSGNWNSDYSRNAWYSNDGVTASVTYKLRMDIDTLLLYRVSKNSETLIGSFTGLSWDTKTGTLKTITELENASKLPKNWRTMKEGRHFQSFKIRYNSSKHCITLTFNKKCYLFYGNLTYGVKHGSDYETVMNSTWECKSGDKSLLLNVYFQQGESFLCIYDKKNSAEYYGTGDITVNETKKKVTIAWSKDICTPAFYKSNIGRKSFMYTLQNGKLLIKYGGKSYIFNKVN